MNGHAVSRTSLSHEEKLSLLEDRSQSDAESESGRADLSSRLRELAGSSPLAAKLRKRIPAGMPLGRLSVEGPGLARRALRALFSIPWRLLVLRLLVFLVPSFLQARITGEKRGRQERLIPTAYLDGMRGLAALFVYFCHYSYQAFQIAQGWGSLPTNRHFLKLPFFRIWYQGPPMVCIFFVISGYALSLKPLKQLRARSFADFSATMSSLVFRRGIRLYLPTAVSTLLIVWLLRVGAYEHTRAFANDRTYMKNVVEPHPDRLETAGLQLWDWARQMFDFVHVFGWDPHGGTPKLDVHLWTIPVEFRCSMYLFLVIIATARLRTVLRFVVLAGVTWFAYRNSHWELCLFYCGMGLAELDLIRGAHIQNPPNAATAAGSSPPTLPLSEKTSSSSPSHGSSRLWCWLGRNLRDVYWWLVCLGALYLLNQPDDLGERTPGWVYLSSLVPKWWRAEKFRYWQSIGAVLFVYGVGHSPCWQRFFNSSVVQYFGKLSYAIYLMHMPVMHTAGYVIERWAYGITGVEGYRYNAGFFLGAAGAVPAVVWAADIFWRAVDIPAVKVSRWVEGKFSIKAA